MSKRDKSGDMTIAGRGDEMDKGKDKAKDKEQMDTLQKYVSDMMAVEEHIGSAVKRQVKDENLAKHTSQAGQLIRRIAETTEQHEQELKLHLEAIGGDAAKGIKEVATAALGTLAGLYDKVRTEAVSKMLRDDYTALNLATVGYTMLHTTGLALNDQATAALALRHLKAYTTIVMEINEIIPNVVVADLRDNGAVINESVLQQAIANTQEVWQRPDNGMRPSGNGISHTGSMATSTTSTTSKPRTSRSKCAGSENTTAGKARTIASKPLSSENTAATTSKPRTTKSNAAPTESAAAKRKISSTSSNQAPAANTAKSSPSSS
jgi:hypothetical protein